MEPALKIVKVKASLTTIGFKRELASVKIFDLYYGLETSPVVRSQLKLKNLHF